MVLVRLRQFCMDFKVGYRKDGERQREFAKQDKVSGLTANSRVRLRVYT